MRNNPSMWSYWRDKRGVLDAIQDDFPEMIEERPDIAQAVNNVKIALGYIDSVMSNLEDQE